MRAAAAVLAVVALAACAAPAPPDDLKGAPTSTTAPPDGGPFSPLSGVRTNRGAPVQAAVAVSATHVLYGDSGGGLWSYDAVADRAEPLASLGGFVRDVWWNGSAALVRFETVTEAGFCSLPLPNGMHAEGVAYRWRVRYASVAGNRTTPLADGRSSTNCGASPDAPDSEAAWHGDAAYIRYHDGAWARFMPQEGEVVLRRGAPAAERLLSWNNGLWALRVGDHVMRGLDPATGNTTAFEALPCPVAHDTKVWVGGGRLHLSSLGRPCDTLGRVVAFDAGRLQAYPDRHGAPLGGVPVSVTPGHYGSSPPMHLFLGVDGGGLRYAPGGGPAWNEPPTLSVQAERRGDRLVADANASSDPEGAALTFRWTLDGNVTSSEPLWESSWPEIPEGVMRHLLVSVTDDLGATASKAFAIEADQPDGPLPVHDA